MRNSPGYLAVLLCALLITACSKPEVTAPADDAVTAEEPEATTETTPPAESPAITAALDEALLGAQNWRLQDASNPQGQRIDALLVRPEQPIQFNLANGLLRVSNACNSMAGGYQLLGDEVRLDLLSGTKMACADPAIFNLDKEIGKHVQGSARITLIPGTPPRMEWRTPNGDVLRFIGEATPDARFGEPGQTMFLEIAPRTKPCQTPSMSNAVECLQVREVRFDAQGVRTGTPGQWQPLPGGVDGYTHEQDVRSVIRVKRFAISGAKVDQPQAAYVFEAQIESEIVAP